MEFGTFAFDERIFVEKYKGYSIYKSGYYYYVEVDNEDCCFALDEMYYATSLLELKSGIDNWKYEKEE